MVAERSGRKSLFALVSVVSVCASGCVIDFDSLSDGTVASPSQGGAHSGGFAGDTAVSGSSGMAGAPSSAGGNSVTQGGSAGLSGEGGAAAGSGTDGGAAGDSASGGSAGSAGQIASAGSGGESIGGAGGVGGSAGGSGPSGGSSDAGSGGIGGCVDTTSDAHHCGDCDHDCLGGTCTKGVCSSELLWSAGTSSTTGVDTILAIDGYVYWSVPDENMVMRIAVGSDTPEVLTNAVTAPKSLAFDGTSLYIAGSNEISFCDPSSCDSTRVIVTTVSSDVYLGANATRLFWATSGTPMNFTDGAINDCNPVNCSSPELLTTDEDQFHPSSLMLDTNNVYWADRGQAESGNGSLNFVTQSSPPAMEGMTIIDQIESPSAIAINGPDLFFTSDGDSTFGVYRTSTNGDAPVKVFLSSTTANPLMHPRAIATDGFGVYFTSDTGVPASSSVMACPYPACTGLVRIVGDVLHAPHSLATISGQLYFGDASGGGRLFRWVIPPKI